MDFHRLPNDIILYIKKFVFDTRIELYSVMQNNTWPEIQKSYVEDYIFIVTAKHYNVRRFDMVGFRYSTFT